VLHPQTRRAAPEELCAKEDGAHNPKGESTAENEAARTTNSVRTTGEHEPKGASPTNPTRGTRPSGRKKTGAHNPTDASHPGTGRGVRLQVRAGKCSAQPEGCVRPQQPGLSMCMSGAH